jgi:hypothetical protein
MKKIILQVVGLVVFGIVIWIGGDWYGAHQKAAVQTTPSPPIVAAPVSHPNAPVVAAQPQPLMSPSQWPEFLSARQAALQANPDLETEHKQILKKMDAQQTKLDAAVIKADPKIKPVIDKLVALRQKNSVPVDTSSTTVAKPAAIGPTVKLTPEDLQELRTARAKALQSNPELVTNAKTIADQMRAFEDKLDAAMLKADPNVSPMIAKFEGGHKASVVATTPQGASSQSMK